MRPELTLQIQQALDETRILMLGTQVLVGFGFRSFFEEGYVSLPRSTQHWMLFELILLLFAMALLIMPGNYHRIVEHGESRPSLRRLTTRVVGVALLPFAAALAIMLFVAGEKVVGRTWGVVLGVGTGIVALTFLYGLEVFRLLRTRSGHGGGMDMDGPGQSPQHTELKVRVQHVLTESRVILPGVQALLGFQFATVLMPAFERLPASSRYIHLVALVMMSLSIILLLAPPAYHRVVERGDETERFHAFASRMVLAATVTLALGLAGDFFVVVRLVTGSLHWAFIATGGWLICAYGLWFGFTFVCRERNRARTPPPRRGHLQALRQ